MGWNFIVKLVDSGGNVLVTENVTEPSTSLQSTVKVVLSDVIFRHRNIVWAKIAVDIERV